MTVFTALARLVATFLFFMFTVTTASLTVISLQRGHFIYLLVCGALTYWGYRGLRLNWNALRGK